MADRSDPFDSIADVLDSVARQLETAARSWESNESESDSSATAANTEIASSTRQRVDHSAHASSISTATAASTSLDFVDEGDEFVVTVDVPGYETDDLEIRLSNSTLSIRGERERERERGDTTAQYVRHEREVQSFSRQLALPEPIAADDVSATLNNGLLTVRLPKRDVSDDDDATSIDIE